MNLKSVLFQFKVESQITMQLIELGGKLNPLQAMVAEGVGDIVSGGDISKQVDTAKDKIAKDEGGIKKFIESATASAALGVSQDELLSRFKGAVVNPNLQLLFKGPTLRPFSFTFTLSPRSKDEATMVRKIIRFFKFNMAIQKNFRTIIPCRTKNI